MAGFRLLNRIFLLCLLGVGLSCASRTPQPIAKQQVSFTDEIGRQISVVPNPQRIVSLAPSLTEILFELELSERVIGVTSYCDYPLEANSKEKIGDTLKPNLERIISLKPDLVLISTASQLEKITQQLDQLNIPVYVSSPKSVTQVTESIRRIGEVTGASQKAEALASSMQQRVEAIRQQQTQKPTRRVLYILQLSPLITAGKNTFINDLIRLAGGQSVAGDEAFDYPQFSLETVIARAPEIIFVPASHGNELVNRDQVKQLLATTPAVKNNRVVSINPDLISRPGPRIVEGLEALQKAINAP